jgi:hypothetical protein
VHIVAALQLAQKQCSMSYIAATARAPHCVQHHASVCTLDAAVTAVQARGRCERADLYIMLQLQVVLATATMMENLQYSQRTIRHTVLVATALVSNSLQLLVSDYQQECALTVRCAAVYTVANRTRAHSVWWHSLHRITALLPS